jgi:FtsH-binding integral membrane protein
VDISTGITELTHTAGDLWFAALVGSFFVMLCESAKPKPEDGESRSSGAVGLIVATLSLATPLMLLVHAFMAAGRSGEALVASIALIGAAIIAAAIIGWIISAFAPAIGRTLSKAAPILALAVFALTAYVTWESVRTFATLLAAGEAF